MDRRTGRLYLAIPTNCHSMDRPTGYLNFSIVSTCCRSKARTARMSLLHSVVETPVFMPVGTQATLKGLLPEQLISSDCRILLGNAYHLADRPGHQLVRLAGGLHRFMNWNQALLTDSGGFQMVSLNKLMSVDEEGVRFESPNTGQPTLLTPEESIRIQNALGADIIMQLDDVVHVLTDGPRVEEAMQRSVRWLDRCVAAHANADTQNLFAIIQGGLDMSLRQQCISQMLLRNCPGYAIGGLSGGEQKHQFWKVVSFCTDRLPMNKPRYVMGIGWPIDLVVCSALGADMFDCVFPTRTARFGTVLVASGQLHLTGSQFARDFRPIENDCPCSTCSRYTRAYLHTIVTKDTVACHLLSVHNINFELRLMAKIRQSIKENRFPEFVQLFFVKQYPQRDFPKWAVEALHSVGIDLLQL